MIYNYYTVMLLLLQLWWIYTREEVSDMETVMAVITSVIVLAGTIAGIVIQYKKDAARFDRIDNALSRNLGDGSKTLRDEHTTLRDEHTTLRDEHTTLHDEHKTLQLEHKDIDYKVSSTLEEAKEIRQFITKEQLNLNAAMQNGIDTASAITAIKAMESVLADKEEQLKSKDRQLLQLNQELADTKGELAAAKQELSSLKHEIKTPEKERRGEERGER